MVCCIPHVLFDSIDNIYVRRGIIEWGIMNVVGGDDGSSNLHSVEYYNPSSDTWSLISTTMEIGRR